jgi:hypothetical protein
MTRQATLGSLAAALLSVCLCVSAQTSSKARISAFTKLPDWSGLWEWDVFTGVADGQQLSREGGRKAAAYFVATTPTFSPAWQPKYDQILKSLAAAVAADPNLPPSTHTPCEAPSFPATARPGMFEWLVMPEETTLVTSLGSVRHIYTDGRTHPPKEELWPTKMGDSVGRWEGDTLVVDTVATKPVLSQFVHGFFMISVPMSDQLHFVERIRMVSHNEMQIQFTTDDPIALTKPMNVTLTFERITDINRMSDEYDCDPATERNPVVNGRFETVVH